MSISHSEAVFFVFVLLISIKLQAFRRINFQNRSLENIRPYLPAYMFGNVLRIID